MTMAVLAVQLLSYVWLFATPWTAASRLPCPSPFPRVCSNSRPLNGDAIQPFNPLSSPSPPAFYLSQYQSLFQWVGSSNQGLKYWSFSFSLSPSNEYSGLIFFRIDWLCLLAVQGTLKSLHQHRNLKASILLCSAFFVVHLSHPYMTTEKAIALILQIFVSKICTDICDVCTFSSTVLLNLTEQAFQLQATLWCSAYLILFVVVNIQ